MRRNDPARSEAVLDDIARFAITARRVVARGTERFFDPDDDDQRRIARSLLVDLATAADRLPESFRDQHPQIDWRGIRATRNYIAHDYSTVRDELMWEALQLHFPALIEKLGLE